MKSIYLLILIPCLFLAYCKKKPSNPINRNSQAVDYCTCNINGKYFKAECAEMFSTCMRTEWSNQKRDFIFTCKNGSSEVITMFLSDSTGLKSGTYVLSKNFKANCGQYQNYNKSYTSSYNTDSAHIGTLQITFDEAHSRVSGTFSFYARYDTDSETVNVTSGNFSLPCQID